MRPASIERENRRPRSASWSRWRYGTNSPASPPRDCPGRRNRTRPDKQLCRRNRWRSKAPVPSYFCMKARARSAIAAASAAVGCGAPMAGWARATNGQAAAEPPSNAMNSRRLMGCLCARMKARRTLLPHPNVLVLSAIIKVRPPLSQIGHFWQTRRVGLLKCVSQRPFSRRLCCKTRAIFVVEQAFLFLVRCPRSTLRASDGVTRC